MVFSEALKDDIAKRGIKLAVEYDEDGNILDGHHRVMACEELGIEWPRVVRGGMNESEKLDYARAMNYHRRHLTQKQKRDQIRQVAEGNPEMSNRAVAREVGVSPSTVGEEIPAAILSVATMPPSMEAQRRVEVDPGSGQKRLNLT